MPGRIATHPARICDLFLVERRNGTEYVKLNLDSLALATDYTWQWREATEVARSCVKDPLGTAHRCRLQDLLVEQGCHVPDPEDDANPVGVNGVKSVNGMSLKVFRQKLVYHFKILFARNEIKWPVRRPLNQMPVT